MLRSLLSNMSRIVAPLSATAAGTADGDHIQHPVPAASADDVLHTVLGDHDADATWPAVFVAPLGRNVTPPPISPTDVESRSSCGAVDEVDMAPKQRHLVTHTDSNSENHVSEDDLVLFQCDDDDDDTGSECGDDAVSDSMADITDAVHPRLCGGRSRANTKNSVKSGNSKRRASDSNVGGYVEYSCSVCSLHWPLWSMCERHAFSTGHGLLSSTGHGVCRLCRLPAVRHVCRNGRRHKRRVAHGCMVSAALRSLGVETVAAAVIQDLRARGSGPLQQVACSQCGQQFGNTIHSAAKLLVEHLFASGHGVCRHCRRCRLPVLVYSVSTATAGPVSKCQLHVCLGSCKWLSIHQRALLPPASLEPTADTAKLTLT